MRWTSLVSNGVVASLVLFGGSVVAESPKAAGVTGTQKSVAVTPVETTPQTRAIKEPVGLVSIEETQFGLIIGGSFGGGILTFDGHSYQFELGGLSLGANIGVSKMAAIGEVYDLQALDEFPGTYVRVEGSVALGGGVGGMTLKNEHGVLMRLKGTTQGLQLNVGASGLSIRFAKEDQKAIDQDKAQADALGKARTTEQTIENQADNVANDVVKDTKSDSETIADQARDWTEKADKALDSAVDSAVDAAETASERIESAVNQAKSK